MELEELKTEAKKLGYRLIPLDWKRLELQREKAAPKPLGVPVKVKAAFVSPEPVVLEPEIVEPEISEGERKIRILKAELKAAGRSFNWEKITRLTRQIEVLEGKRV